MKKTLLLLCTFLLLVGASISFNADAKRKSCTKYQNKYQTLQNKLRQSNSIKQSNKLNDKARKAFHQWQQCKQGKLKKG